MGCEFGAVLVSVLSLGFFVLRRANIVFALFLFYFLPAVNNLWCKELKKT